MGGVGSGEPSARARAPLAPRLLSVHLSRPCTPTQCLVGRHRNNPGNKQRRFAVDGEEDVDSGNVLDTEPRIETGEPQEWRGGSPGGASAAHGLEAA